MPKQEPNAHFDVASLLAAVAAQEVGLFIVTNNGERFKQLLYREIAKETGPRCHIYSVPNTEGGFFLLRQALPSAQPAGEVDE